jgi:hypothetical protein
MSASTRSLATIVITLVLGLGAVGCSERAPKAAEGSAEGSAERASVATPQAGSYEGFIDEVSCQVVRGWAWDPSRPDAALEIDLYDGDRLLKTVVADQLRPDLVDGGKGNGRHVFHEVAPAALKDGKPHAVRAVIKGTNYALKPSAGTSVSVTCASSGT